MALKGGAEKIESSCVHRGPSVLSALSLRLPVLLLCKDDGVGGGRELISCDGS